MKMRMQKKSLTGGFTLIEVLISLLIFSIVITVAVGALFSMVDAGEESRSINSVMQNLDVALETMAETVRTGTGYSSSATCDNPSNALSLQVPSSSYLNTGLPTGVTITNVVYSLQNNQIIETVTYSNGNKSVIPITAVEVHVTDLVFWIHNCTATAPAKPYVLMAVQGFVETRQSNKASFNIQTTMTER